MNDLLMQLGVTKEEIIGRIVSTALGITADYRQTGEESWDNIPLSSVVDKKIETAIGNLIDQMRDKVQSRIDTIMEVKINEVFNTPFQRIDRWGTKVGEPVTIRDLIFNEAANYWTAKVGSDGKPNASGYGESTERAVWYARKVMTEVYDKELVDAVKLLAGELKARIPATIAEEITATVVKHLK